MLQVKNISKAFGWGKRSIPILTDLSLELQPGEEVAIVGPSGSGKSTLLALLAGLDLPDKGEIRVLGQSLGALSEAQLAVFRAQKIGIVFQRFHLLEMLTALENVLLPLEILGQPDLEKARWILDQVGLSQRLHHLPHQLSGGEQQRVAIARALVSQPALLLADEPSGNLDRQTGEQVMNILFDLVKAAQTSLILVTHDEALAARCQRQWHLHDGQLRC